MNISHYVQAVKLAHVGIVQWTHHMLNVTRNPQSCLTYDLSIAIDIVCDHADERAQYPDEFLNSFTPCRLKVGADVMLLQNLNLREDLCNGTCMFICHLHDNCIDAEVLTGKAKHTRVLTPRL